MKSKFPKLENILKKASEEKNTIDWKAKQKKWLAEVDNLYKLVNKWLAPFVEKKYVNIEREVSQLVEDFVGPYAAHKLICTVGKNKIVFQPIGMNIIAARGRVDILGPRGQKIMLLLLGENEVPAVTVSINLRHPMEKLNKDIATPEKVEPLTLVWKVSGINGSRRETTALNEDTFSEIFEQLLN